MSSPLAAFYRGRSVLVTGHTGFKGGWMSLWLAKLGARVTGLALAPEEGCPSLFDVANVGACLDSRIGDVRDTDVVDASFAASEPEVVFHLAAQSLVRRSYDDPVGTWATNVMGTAHVLEAARRTPSVRAVVVVTSDKCYENREWSYAYRENDPLGGYDPYSSSKAGAEIVTAAWRQSFFGADGGPPAGIATARAGNVIGGGDWAQDRLVPDCVTALAEGARIPIRSPSAIRPWQHVLEPVSGYLWLAAALADRPQDFASAWNFGPDSGGNDSVRGVADRVVAAWGSGGWDDLSEAEQGAPHEATFLRLDCSRAANVLGWRPVFDLDAAVRETVVWYRGYHEASDFDAGAFTLAQIEAYEAAGRAAGLPWARP